MNQRNRTLLFVGGLIGLAIWLLQEDPMLRFQENPWRIVQAGSTSHELHGFFAGLSGNSLYAWKKVRRPSQKLPCEPTESSFLSQLFGEVTAFAQTTCSESSCQGQYYKQITGGECYYCAGGSGLTSETDFQPGHAGPCDGFKTTGVGQCGSPNATCGCMETVCCSCGESC